MNEQLPDGWVESSLGEIADWSSGGTPDTKNKEYYDGDIAWVVTGDLTDSYVSTSQKTITKAGLENSSAKIVPIGSVMIAMYGASIGRLGIADFECATNQAIAYTKRIYGGISNRFLFYYLQAKKEEFVGLGVGGAQPNISQTILKEFPIPLPPLVEQARIVAALDGLLGRVRLAHEQLNEIDKIENKLLHSYTTNDENELLPNVKLEQYCEEGTKRIGSNWPGKRLVGVSKEDGITDLRVGTKVSFENYKIVQPGDFVYNPMRVDIGSIALYEDETIAITSPDYVVFRVKHTLSSLLLLKFLKSELGLAEINNNTQGSVRSRLYFSNLCKINFPLGEEAAQLQAQKLLSIFEKLGRQRKELDEKLDFMKQGFLAKAFAGELTQQDPTDEPASTLLERIQTERLVERQVSKERKRQILDFPSKPYEKMAEQQQKIEDILASNEPMLAVDVWKKSIYYKEGKDERDNGIDDFYAELKRLVDVEGSVKDIKEGNETYLQLSRAN